MSTLAVPTVGTTPARTRIGSVVSAIPVLFLTFDTVIKLLELAPVNASFVRLGYDARVAVAIGSLELVCLVLYLLPRTAIIGAVLLTGYLGGAIASHMRVGDPLFTHTLFPTYVAVLLWGGLYLRDERLRHILRRTVSQSTTPGNAR